MADKYLNQEGVSALWSKVGDLFGSMSSRIAELEAWKTEQNTEYVGVEYLQSGSKPNSNTQYINTKYLPTGNTRIVMDIQFLANEGGYRVMGEQNVNGQRFRFGSYSGTGYLVRYAGQPDFNMAYGNYNPLDRHTVELSRYFKIDDNQLKDFGAQTFTATNPILLFGINDTSIVDCAHMKLYSCQIYEGTELVRNFKPCRHRFLTGYEGLYDTVEDKLYINQGSGVFNVGADTGEKW